MNGVDYNGFQTEHEKWLQQHLSKRSGERRSRLERGHRHGEMMFAQHVWWPLKGNFHQLHPEYEVLDWRGRSYFADFVWLVGHVKLIIEIKGYQTHVKDMDRQRFCNELNRETFLSAMGYSLISFAYDDIEQRPELCITLLRMILSHYQPAERPITKAVLAEKEVIRFAIQHIEPIRPVDIQRQLQIDHKTAVLLLHKLCTKGWLTPSTRGNGIRNVRYALGKDVLNYI